MILIFAGAGASSAVSTTKYPTTIEYFKKLDLAITNDQLFKIAKNDVQNSNETLDIENILFRLGKLKEQLHPTNHIKEYTNFYTNVLKEYKIEPNLATIIESINKKVFSFYGQIPTEDEVEHNWLKLLKILENSESKYEIVTTNYDTNIETSVAYLKNNNIDISVNDGFENTLGQGESLNAQLWSKYDKDSKRGLITKLHGSVNWYGDKHHIHRSKPRYQGEDKHPIIYPGFKGNPNNNKNLNANLHTYFERLLPHVKHVLFIGFAFRDDYINNLLNNLNPIAKITNIGYGAEPTKIPERLTNNLRTKNYIYLDKGFGKETLEVFESRLLEKE